MSKPQISEHQFATLDALNAALLEFVSALLCDAVAKNGQTSWYLSGGNTPKTLYQMLAASPLDWTHIYSALVDERWVEGDHPSSNEGMLRTAFASNNQILQNLMGMKTQHTDPFAAESDNNARYSTLPAPHSLCLLGMGPDGHTASLFPHATGLAEALTTTSPCKAIRATRSEVTGEHTERMSLSLAGILRCEQIVLFFTGAAKWKVYHDALTSSDWQQTPIAAILQQTQRPIAVFYCP